MHLPLALAAALLGSPSADSAAVDLVRRMHDRYAGKWPESVTFVQTSTFHEDDSTRVETWYEAVGSPSMLRIDFAPLEGGNGVIFRADSVYAFKAGKQVFAGPEIHPLMVLSRDVYGLPPDRTIEKLRALGFDLSRMREDTWQGRPVHVVGAESGDLESPQFWVAAENLVFVRLIQPSKQDPSRIEEVQFNGYRPLGQGWIETEVLFFENGKLVFEERYADTREGVEFEPDLFEPASWDRPGWVDASVR